MTTHGDLKPSRDLTFLIMKIYFIKRRHQEFILEEDDLFKISENKNPLKITHYMV